MSHHSPAPARKVSPGLWALVVVILLPAIVLPLWVPLFDKTDPTLWGFPFFFWFQFGLIVLSAVLVLAAYGLVRAAEARARTGDPR
jgi:hypothetical protein